jgi:hypothetical protein
VHQLPDDYWQILYTETEWHLEGNYTVSVTRQVRHIEPQAIYHQIYFASDLKKGVVEMSDWNKEIIAEFRANRGKVDSRFKGADLLLLHTKGAKSGLEHVSPVRYFIDGDRYVVIASKGGADTHPDWYHNLLANPDVSVSRNTTLQPPG